MHHPLIPPPTLLRPDFSTLPRSLPRRNAHAARSLPGPFSSVLSPAASHQAPLSFCMRKQQPQPCLFCCKLLLLPSLTPRFKKTKHTTPPLKLPARAGPRKPTAKKDETNTPLPPPSPLSFFLSRPCCSQTRPAKPAACSQRPRSGRRCPGRTGSGPGRASRARPRPGDPGCFSGCPGWHSPC